MKNKKIRWAKVVLLFYRIMGFFSPKFKTMERAAILREISKLMNPEYEGRYAAGLQSTLISGEPIGVHELTYHVLLSSGTLEINLNYDSGEFRHDYGHHYANRLNSFDYKELGEATSYFDGQIDHAKMVDLFGQLK